MKTGDKVYVIDWGGRYSYKGFPFKNKVKQDWSNSISAHWERKWAPKLTAKGTPYKNGEQVLVSEYPIYKEYEYTILEIIPHPKSGVDICLLQSEQGCVIVMNKDSLGFLTPEERENLKEIIRAKQSLKTIRENLGKWSRDDNLREFPKELLKVLYDGDQRVLFGSSMTKGIVTYKYISKEYTKNGNNLFHSSEVSYNGEGCSLEGKETITWGELPAFFPENTFKN